MPTTPYVLLALVGPALLKWYRVRTGYLRAGDVHLSDSVIGAGAMGAIHRLMHSRLGMIAHRTNKKPKLISFDSRLDHKIKQRSCQIQIVPGWADDALKLTTRLTAPLS
jgi:hypothetical protein